MSLYWHTLVLLLWVIFPSSGQRGVDILRRDRTPQKLFARRLPVDKTECVKWCEELGDAISLKDLNVLLESSAKSKKVVDLAPCTPGFWFLGLLILLSVPSFFGGIFVVSGGLGDKPNSANDLRMSTPLLPEAPVVKPVEFAHIWDNISSVSTHRKVMGTFSLRFKELEMEQLYIRSQADRISKGAGVVVAVVTSYAAYCLLIILSKRGYPKFQSILLSWNSSPRVLYNCSYLTMFFCGIAVLIWLRLGRKKHASRKFVEPVIVFWFFIVAVVFTLFGNRFFAAKLANDDPVRNFSYYYPDAALLNDMICLIVFVLLYTPLRFCILAPMAFMVYLMYPMLCLSIGGPDAVIWRSAFQFHNEDVIGSMGYMELGQVTWFLLLLIGILCGQRSLEHRRRHDFMTLVESSRRMGELENQDNDGKGSGALERGVKALEDASKILEVLKQHSVILAAGINGEIERLVEHVKVAQKSLENVDRIFKLSVDDVFASDKYAKYKENSDIKGFVEMIGADSGLDTSFSSLDRSAVSVVQMPKGTARTTQEAPLERRSAAENKLMGMLSGVGYDWDFDPLAVARETGNRTLMHVGEIVMVSSSWKDALIGTSVDVMRCFIREIHRRYPPNDYHNEAHGANVAHMALWFGTEVGFMDKIANDIEKMSLMISALCHDVGHFSRNTNFLVMSRHTLAMIWNDSAPLENMHAATTFTIAGKEGCEIFRTCSAKDFKLLRRLIIEFILATDLKSHAASIMKFAARREAADFLNVPSGKDALERWAEDKCMVGKMLMQASDIGHAGLSWELHKEWSFRIIAEFFAQGDEEKQLGLAVSPLCERKGYKIVGNQSFFIDFLAATCIEQLEAIACEDGRQQIKDEVLKQCEENKKHWSDFFGDETKWDPLSHSIAAIDYKYKASSLANKPPIMPYPMPSPLPPLRLVGTEELLREITSFRKAQGSGDAYESLTR